MSRRSVRWSSDAVSDLANQIAWIAFDNPAAARRVVAALDRAALALGDMPTGRPGRVTGTYEKLVNGLPYILAYVLTGADEQEEVAIRRGDPHLSRLAGRRVAVMIYTSSLHDHARCPAGASSDTIWPPHQ